MASGWGQLLPSKRNVVTGRNDIRTFWHNAFDSGFKTVARETVELDEQGETAIEVGRYTLCAALDAVADIGEYIVIWQHENGTWKLHRAVWNSGLLAEPGNDETSIREREEYRPRQKTSMTKDSQLGLLKFDHRVSVWGIIVTIVGFVVVVLTALLVTYFQGIR